MNDPVLHTKKAIQSLKSEVRLFLRKHDDDILPQINKRSQNLSRDYPFGPRNSKFKIQSETPICSDSSQKKIHKTISFEDHNRTNAIILKPHNVRRNHFFLPSIDRSFQNGHESIQRYPESYSMQFIESTLLQQASPIEKQSKESIQRKTRRFNIGVERQPRYSTKTSLSINVISEDNVSPENYKFSRESDGQKLKSKGKNKEKGQASQGEYYSPWETTEDCELIQIYNMQKIQ